MPWVDGICVNTLSAIYLPDVVHEFLQGYLAEIVELDLVHARSIEGTKFMQQLIVPRIIVDCCVGLKETLENLPILLGENGKGVDGALVAGNWM